MAAISKDMARSVRAAASLLGVRRGASVDDVIQARRVQAKLWHPDIREHECVWTVVPRSQPLRESG
jgi:curved DNA-binding protein CbpA